MKYYLPKLGIAVWLVALVSCQKQPDYPIQPVIELETLSKLEMVQNAANIDSITIVLNYTDGDGDLGTDGNEYNVFLKDSRTGLESFYRIPQLPQNGGSSGISGQIELINYTTCCIFTDGQPPCTPSTSTPTNTMYYTIYIKDRAGNISNEVITPEITLFCN